MCYKKWTEINSDPSIEYNVTWLNYGTPLLSPGDCILAIESTLRYILSVHHHIVCSCYNVMYIYYRVIALISADIVPSFVIEGRELDISAITLLLYSYKYFK